MAAPIFKGGRAYFSSGTRMKNFVTFNKTITGIPDETATTIFTINLPNPPTGSFVSSLLYVTLMGVLGAGGAVAAGEGISFGQFMVGVTRTPGLASVIAVSAIVNGSTAAVSGGTTPGVATLTNVSVAGANTAAQTFVMQTSVDDDTSTATNHVAVVWVVCQNAGMGVTFS